MTSRRGTYRSMAKFEYIYDTCLMDFYRGKDLDF